MIATLGAPERRLLDRRRRAREAPPEPEPAPVTTTRVTIIDVSEPLEEPAASEWLARAGEDELEAGVVVLNRALHAFRVVTADPYMHPVSRSQAIVARIGIGAGEDVADGRWRAARELIEVKARRKRAVALAPQARLAGILTGHDTLLACQELTLRARLDLDYDRPREAALQLLVALDAAIAELSIDARAHMLAERVAELRERREPTAQAAQAALAGPLSDADRESIAFTLGRIEAALRARAAASS